MNQNFAVILHGLMDAREMSPRAMSRASARAESTILQLLSGHISPSTEILRDIAPVLQIPEADLLIIAGLTARRPASHAKPYRNSAQIGELVSIASSLADEQVRRLLDFARNLEAEA
ncbi:helix-turn-helix domain-containing protein [Amycolatopsis sp. EV170708-02-1]|uniref:helix-turn-helix domain-containing protein n=1 Tax=Amycolatopsis sp. EV170708-02-1 TaxID=2919322 RepID=UPI001F0C5400|nr:helix-turn-helix domain-containing protein [Amycolatopsis sp. EV170708-02-1]UMP01669.1 helix-turn-helix domain-containing protein [Amycolatopsis sp. EV170708-02-1]